MKIVFIYVRINISISLMKKEQIINQNELQDFMEDIGQKLMKKNKLINIAFVVDI